MCKRGVGTKQISDFFPPSFLLMIRAFEINPWNSSTVRNTIPARHRRLQAHWWERQTWRKGRGSSAAASESCTSPSTGRTSRRCSLTEPWQPRWGSGHLWIRGVRNKEQAALFNICKVKRSAVVREKILPHKSSYIHICLECHVFQRQSVWYVSSDIFSTKHDKKKALKLASVQCHNNRGLIM